MLVVKMFAPFFIDTMMPDMNFRFWLENNIFGFDDSREIQNPYRPGKVPLKGPNDLPIERLNVQRVIEELSKNDLGVKRGNIRFFNECQWGSNPGAVRAVITPKINVKIQRLHHDLEGNSVWILKKYFFIDDVNFSGKEDVVASEIFDQVKKINDEQLEAPKRNIKVSELVEALSSKLSTIESTVLVPGHQVKKVSDDEFVLFYYLRGGGASAYLGSRNARNVMEVVVNVSNDKKTGLIKSIVSVVNSQDEGASWQLQPADFNELFMPTQGKREIVESIITALKTY
jgi:hypothetical protein